MKRNQLFLFLILTVLLVLVSCGGGEPQAHVFDAKSLDDNWVNVSSRDTILIENMNPDVMYAVRTKGRGRRTLRGAVTDSNIFKGSENTFIPIPDKNFKSSFTSNEIEIVGSGNMKIIELRSGSDDFTIKEAEDPISYYDSEGSKVYEEYYHVDFSEAPYDKLDKSRIALLTYGTGSGSGGSNFGFCTIDAGGMQESDSLPKLYDFSSYDSVNLYHTVTISHSDSPWEEELIITSPNAVEENKPFQIPSKMSVISFVPDSDNPDAEYVLEIHEESGLYYMSDFNFRYTDGYFKNFPLKLNSPADTEIYYIGQLSGELIANIGLYIGGYKGTDFGTVTIRKASKAESDEYKSHYFKFDSDKVVFTTTIGPRDYNEKIYFVDPESTIDLSNMQITIEYTYADGSYTEGYCDTVFATGHEEGIGYGTCTVFGAYFKDYGLDKQSILAYFSVFTMDTEEVNVKITFEKKTEEIVEDWRVSSLYVVPNNGDEPTLETMKPYSTYTVPQFTREGYTFRGMYYSGRLYQPGESITIDNLYTSIIGAWDKNPE